MNIEMHEAFGTPRDRDLQIVIGIHIGTSYSIVSYALLQKGISPLIYSVDMWPGQYFRDSSRRVPTLVYYDTDGQAVAFGAEAGTRKAKRDAKNNKWQLAKDFKSYMHPVNPRHKSDTKTWGLPNNISLKTIYSDFLRYLIKNTRSRFETIIMDGKGIWEKNHSNMTVIMTHSNGWGGVEQHFLREVAVTAGLATPTDATPRVYFVSEAEAAIHLCIHHTNLRSCLHVGEKIVLCNVGDSITETTLYTVCERESRVRLSDVQGYLRTQAGAIYVRDEAEKHLRELFGSPKAGLTEEEINEYVLKGIEDFETTAARQFGVETGDEEVFIKFADDNFENEELCVMFGAVSLESEDVRSFFEPCVTATIRSIESVASGEEISYIALVGELGGNAYLQKRIKEHFKDTGVQLVAGDEDLNLLAAGAVVWHCASN